jgi:membrane peptidoglycan carboxypeptidase
MLNGHPRTEGTDGGYANGDNGYANGDHAAVGGHGVLKSTVDYDLGYDANGWDTQGFRSPEAGYRDGKETGGLSSQVPGSPDDSGVGTAHRRGNGRVGSHARTSDQQHRDQLAWEPETRTGPWIPEHPVQPGRRSSPRGFRGPARRGPRGRDSSRIKVKGSWWRHWTLRKALGVLLGAIGALIVLGAIAVAVAYEETPVPTEAMAATSYAQSVVYSSNGTLIGRFGTTNRQMLSYSQIPPMLINAVLAAEDRHFWTEGGISPTGIMRAAFDDITGRDGSLQGGSTITQQFVRNYYAGIGTQQTMSRKLKEIFVAMKVAKEKSKQWILENYLNTIFLGQGAYGVQAAAQTYFDKPVSQLSPAQDAVIAALIQQPSTYPLPQYRAELKARWSYVIDGMVQMGKLTAQQAAAMKFPKVGDYVAQSFGKNVWDPYILNMVYNELTQIYGFSWSQIYDGGYVIKTSIDDAKMAALYQAVVQNIAQINASADPFKDYMHVGAVLEDPATGAIQALYPGPGYPGWKYNGTGHVITAKECRIIACNVNMAIYNREQVGSSFKPYVLAAAVEKGMNVQTSTLNGYNPLWIPPDTMPTTYASITQPADSQGWHQITNDDAGENGPFTPQVAMAESINTAYTDLWHRVGGNAVVAMAQAFGVDVTDPNTGILPTYVNKQGERVLAPEAMIANPPRGVDYDPGIKDTTGLALGEASITVAEQASMLATIDDNGVYHDAHVITSITRNGVQTPIKIISYPVFSPNSTTNTEEDSQVQYAMSEDTTSIGTAPVAAMSNGQEIIAKTGTTDTAESAFFIGAIPSQTLAVALFTSEQDGKVGGQSLNNLGGNSQGGFGGTWPATIWHTYAENNFLQLGVEPFQPVVFSGKAWNQVPPGLRVIPKKPKKRGGFPIGQPSPPPRYPGPYPTYSCDPQLVTCNPGGGAGSPSPPPFGEGNQTVNATAAGAAAGGVFAALPATCLWVRRRTRKRGAKRG